MRQEEGTAASAADAQSVSHDAAPDGKMGAMKPKSAPGSASGEKPKWITSKGNTLKEIETWATDGHENDAPDYARHSGQLMDNVTEQRMLTAKLWELSKERHKFLTQNSYDKKIFLDRQQRKSGALREMLDGVTPDGRRTGWADEALRRRANVQEETVTPSSARSVLLDRVDPKKRRDRPKDWESRHSSCPTPSESGRRTLLSLPQVAPSVVTSHDGQVPNKNPRLRAATVFPTEPLPKSNDSCSDASSKRPKSSYDRMIGTQLQPADHPPTTVRFADSNRQAASQPDDDVTDGRRAPSRAWSTAKWNRPVTLSARSRMTEREPEGPSADPRYLQLRQSLAANYFNRTQGAVNIAKIIGTVEALHKPTRRSKDTQSRVTHRVREFMRERGLQF